MTLDHVRWSAERAELQDAADAAAVAVAKELVAGTGTSYQQGLADALVRASLGAGHSSGVVVAARTLTDGRTVEVVATRPAQVVMSGLLGTAAPDLTVRAVATASGETICVIGLDPSESGTIRLDSNARLTAKGCSVYSNAATPAGIESKSNAVLAAGLICSVGGVSGSAGNFTPAPLTDCPAVVDPLADRQAPAAGPCLKVGFSVKDGSHTLDPGTYCGGITVDSNAKVTLKPGVYIVKDGELLVDSNGILIGDYVTVVLAGKNAKFRFTSNAKVELGASKSGPLAGILFFGDRNAEKERRHEITSNQARKLLGTIYLPAGRFVVDANNPVADQSAYTAIVVRRLEMTAGPNLVVNSDYGATDVPVPPGLGPVVGKARLLQ